MRGKLPMLRQFEEWRAHRRARFMRADAQRYARPDARRFVRPDAERWLRDGGLYFDSLTPLDALTGKANFDPNQPRVPAGNPDGGQWTDDARWTGGGINDPRVLSDAAPDDEWKPGAQYASNRPMRGQFPGATPQQQARLAAAELRATTAIRRVREIEANWEPRVASLTAPRSINGAISHIEARAQAAEARLRELARQPHDRLLEAYRRSNAPPDMFAHPWSRKSNTVAVATPGEGQIFFGTNSRAPTYPNRDKLTARQTVRTMREEFPTVMNRQNAGGAPNNALFHAESTILLRMRDGYGGTLAGLTFRVTADRRMCTACELVLPRLGMHLGNPRVSYYDGAGLQGIMHHNEWLFLRPR